MDTGPRRRGTRNLTLRRIIRAINGHGFYLREFVQMPSRGVRRSIHTLALRFTLINTNISFTLHLIWLFQGSIMLGFRIVAQRPNLWNHDLITDTPWGIIRTEGDIDVFIRAVIIANIIIARAFP